MDPAGDHPDIRTPADADQLDGGDGRDSANGGDGADVISGGAGPDALNGDADCRRRWRLRPR